MSHRLWRSVPSRRAFVGAADFSASNYLQTAVPGGEAGTAAGFGVLVLFVPTVQSGGAAKVILDRFNAAPFQGYSIYTATGNQSLFFVAVDGAATPVNSPAYTITTSSVGKAILALGVHDGTTVRLYVNGAQVGAGTAITGYTAATLQTCIGGRRSGTPSDGCNVMSAVTYVGVLTAMQIADIFDRWKDACSIPPVPGETHRWDMAKNPPPASVLDQTGTNPMTVVGALTTSSSMDIAGA